MALKPGENRRPCWGLTEFSGFWQISMKQEVHFKHRKYEYQESQTTDSFQGLGPSWVVYGFIKGLKCA